MSQEVYTMEQYQTLCAAIGQGVTMVKYGDKEVNYRTLPEMLRIKSLMESSLGIKKTIKRKVASFTKGLK